jgi:hypothetical protein
VAMSYQDKPLMQAEITVSAEIEAVSSKEYSSLFENMLNGFLISVYSPKRSFFALYLRILQVRSQKALEFIRGVNA